VGGAVIASGLVVAALALPWLVLLPLSGAGAAAAHAAALVAAFHGAGLVVARLAGQRAAAPLLIVQWGIAALIGLSGLTIAIHAGTLAIHAALVFGCVSVHTGALGLGFSHYTARVEAALAVPRPWLVPAALLAGLGALVVLGAAGDRFPHPFDDDGHLVAQLRRVLDTGALADPIGYPRAGGLGGQIALAAVAAGAGDGFGHAVDALALVLALGLAAVRIGAADRTAALWAVILIAAGFALALAPADPLPCWTAVGLVVALHAMLGEPDPPALPLALTAGALIALRYELLPIAAVAVIAAWWDRRRAHRRTALLAVGVAWVVAPLAIERAAAWRSVPGFVHAQLAGPAQGSLALRVALAAVIAGPAALVLRLALPDRASRWAAVATAVALGAVAAHVTGSGGYSLRLIWPIAIAFAITLVIELAREGHSGPAALIASLALCLVIYDGSQATGRRRWWYRMAEAATSIDYLQRPPADPADPYAPLFAQVPADAIVAVWVAEPERLDYAHHRIFDLRTPAGARLREHHWKAHAGKLAPLLAGIGASFLLIEDDDARVERIQSDLLYRLACQEPRPICADDLEAITLGHPVVAHRGNVRLVDLQR
jgi:hypothetical protein